MDTRITVTEGGMMPRSSPAPKLALLTAGLLVAFTLAAAPAAQAAYSGQNGRVAFIANLDGAWQLYTMKPGGTGLRKVTDFPDNDVADMLPDWSPDGTRIAFMF